MGAAIGAALNTDRAQVAALSEKEGRMMVNVRSQTTITTIPTGWRCPACHRINAPTVAVCPCSTQLRIDPFTAVRTDPAP